MDQPHPSPGVLSNGRESADPGTRSPSRSSEAPERSSQSPNPNSLPTKTSILPVLLPPATLRPVAFRTFTRKHNLTISSSALQLLAAFVGKNCGSGWREEGLAELVLDEVAKAWKKCGGGVIVEEGKGASLKSILQAVEGTMSGGRIALGRVPSGDRAASSRSPDAGSTDLNRSNIHSTPDQEDQEEDSGPSMQIRNWIKAIDAFDLPRLSYNTDKKYFQTTSSRPTLLPPPSHKAAFLRDRYTLVHQRLLRNESFQASLVAANGSSSFGSDQRYRLAPISNLLGRSGTSHFILGLLSVSPAGDLSLVDLTGSVALDLSHARSIPEDGAWFTPGMVVLVDGIYEDEESATGSRLGGNSGVGGAIGGRFVAVSICGPPSERRETSLGTGGKETGDVSSAGGFGWVDFLGVGSERARGPRMRKVQTRCLQHAQTSQGASSRPKIAIMSEVNLDNFKTLDALKSVFGSYNSLPLDERPLTFILIGNFVRNAVINGSGQAGSVEYKEYFDSLAMVLSEFPSLLRHSTFVFVPGDNDPWASAFSAGAASTIPRRGIPELFTSRVKRAFTTANSETDSSHAAPAGEAIWTSNPSRLTLFGPVHDLAIFRDDVSSRLRRSAVSTKSTDTEEDAGTAMDADNADNAANDVLAPTADEPPTDTTTSSAIRHGRRLVKTILDQGTMSPFPLTQRPVLWDHASALQLYPLPTAFVLADAEAAPFCVTYEGCHVMNPGRLVPEDEVGAGASVRWVEYDLLRNRGRVRVLPYQ
jgi:DNA polymerase epsilon subunit 2